jgi:PadR family transcriptional regulator PadR
MLVLKILMSGHLHGYAIAQLIPQFVRRSAARLRRLSLPELTPDGRKHLAGESARYRQVTGAVARIMGFV